MVADAGRGEELLQRQPRRRPPDGPQGGHPPARPEGDRRQFDDDDILTNCRQYPKDEAPAAYKDFDEVLRSVTGAGLASEVARLRARFVIKDASKADD